MRYCKKCHVLYSSFAAACPKCGALTEKRGEPPDGGEPLDDARRVRRDWLWIAVGVPALIAVTYLIVYLVKRFA